MKKTLDFIQEIGTIMYVGGILSHIVIGVTIAHPDGQTAFLVYSYKEISAYILILPGLGLKVACDLILYFGYGVRSYWLKGKMLMMAFLSANAFIFLVPMMPELVELARQSPADGPVSQAFLDKAAIEAMVGQSNVVPLIIEMVLGSFKPKLFSERKAKLA